jgi:hypothetical protein
LKNGKSIKKKLQKTQANQALISRRISALKNSLKIKKISQSPENHYDFSQNKSQWLSIRDFEKKKGSLDNSFLNEFRNDYSQGSLRDRAKIRVNDFSTYTNQYL